MKYGIYFCLFYSLSIYPALRLMNATDQAIYYSEGNCKTCFTRQPKELMPRESTLIKHSKNKPIHLVLMHDTFTHYIIDSDRYSILRITDKKDEQKVSPWKNILHEKNLVELYKNILIEECDIAIEIVDRIFFDGSSDDCCANEMKNTICNPYILDYLSIDNIFYRDAGQLNPQKLWLYIFLRNKTLLQSAKNNKQKPSELLRLYYFYAYTIAQFLNDFMVFPANKTISHDKALLPATYKLINRCFFKLSELMLLIKNAKPTKDSARSYLERLFNNNAKDLLCEKAPFCNHQHAQLNK